MYEKYLETPPTEQEFEQLVEAPFNYEGLTSEEVATQLIADANDAITNIINPMMSKIAEKLGPIAQMVPKGVTQEMLLCEREEQILTKSVTLAMRLQQPVPQGLAAAQIFVDQRGKLMVGVAMGAVPRSHPIVVAIESTWEENQTVC